MWEGPPQSQTWMTALALPLVGADTGAVALLVTARSWTLLARTRPAALTSPRRRASRRVRRWSGLRFSFMWLPFFADRSLTVAARKRRVSADRGIHRS